jgi:hypothetical protein
MLFWLLLILRRLLLIDLIVIASSVKISDHDISKYYSKQSSDKKRHNQSHGLLPLPQAADVSSSNIFAPIDDPPVTVSHLETLFHRYMFQPSITLSITQGNKSWLLNSML